MKYKIVNRPIYKSYNSYYLMDELNNLHYYTIFTDANRTEYYCPASREKITIDTTLPLNEKDIEFSIERIRKLVLLK